MWSLSISTVLIKAEMLTEKKEFEVLFLYRILMFPYRNSEAQLIFTEKLNTKKMFWPYIFLYCV